MITTLLALVAIPQGAPSTEPRLLHYPAISGENLVFTFAGDLWLGSTKPGTIARRLTSSPGPEAFPRISPDGKLIAFSAAYEGNLDVYTIPIEGGEPTRLTFEPQPEYVIGWTPDGKIAYTSNYGNATNRDDRLWLIPPTGGLPVRTPIDEIEQGSFTPDGKTLVYQRFGSQAFNWRRYRGGTQGRISLYNFTTRSYSELPSGREQSYYPMVVGDRVYYISDKANGTLNLFEYNLSTKKDTQLTKNDVADIRRPSTDGKSIVYERDGYLYRYDIAAKSEERLAPRVLSDNLRTRPALRNLAANIGDFSLSPSGSRLAVEARGEIFSVPVGDGDTRTLAGSQTSRERFPAWSPDGKFIAYVSDATGEYEVYIRPAKGGEPTKLTAGLPKSPLGIVWSPNSKLIAVGARSGDISIVDIAAKTQKVFSTEMSQRFVGSWSPDSKYFSGVRAAKNEQGAVYVYDVATEKMSEVTNGFYNDSDVAFDQAGKYLYILSDRTFNQPQQSDGSLNLNVADASRVYVVTLKKDTPNPLATDNTEEPEAEEPKKPADAKPADAKPAEAKPEEPSIDFDGIGSRLIPLPWSAGTYRGLISARNGVFLLGPSGLTRFDLSSKESQPIIQGPVPGFTFNENRTKIAYALGGRIGVADVRPGLQLTPGAVNLSGVEAVINPRAEWTQIYWEAWRWIRDNYYDPKIRGLDWDGLGKRYAAYLPYASSRGDLNEIIGLLIGELGTGHSYVNGGDPGPSVTPIPTGQLGVDYEVSEGKIRFQKVYRGFNEDETRRGPLGEPGVNVQDGDYLLAIDGTPLDAKTSPSSLLINKAGRYVNLLVNSKPTTEGARTIRVRPIADETNLRYAEWVESRRQMVEKLSGGRIGYMHIPNTSEGGAEGLVRGFNGQTDKEALVVDERNNGGGNLPWFFVEKLGRTSKTRIQRRYGRDTDETQVIPGPKVMLINQNAGSGGDMLPYLFRKSNLGPLVGTRTWGGLVGIAESAPLLDGGFLTAPEFSIFDPETNEIVAENTGVDPDITIDNTPAQTQQGRDPQLERAVEYLLDQLKKQPAKTPRKDVPVVNKKGRIGG